MSIDKKTEFHVVIIGAGTVGLLLAQGLTKRGIKCTIYEREAYLQERCRDWSFGIYWAQNLISACLPDDLNKKLPVAQTNPFELPNDRTVLPILNCGTGETIINVPVPYVYRLSRSKMRKLLVEGVDVKFGKRLQGVTDDGEKATVHFEDGTSISADLIVGADGAKSRVRDFLLGEEAVLQALPLMIMSCVVSLPAETSRMIYEEYSRMAMLGYSKKGIVCFLALHDVPDLENPETYTWFLSFTWNYTDNPSRTEDAAQMKAQWAEWVSTLAEPFKSIYESKPADARLWCESLSQWPTVPWDNHGGRVTLAGDAAHPMTFHRGQGLNNAVEDAAKLSDLLQEYVNGDEKSLADVVSLYEKEMVPRGHKAVIDSGQNSMMVHNWDELMNSDVMKYGLRKKTG